MTGEMLTRARRIVTGDLHGLSTPEEIELAEALLAEREAREQAERELDDARRARAGRRARRHTPTDRRRACLHHAGGRG